jgi:hypothetical protein
MGELGLAQDRLLLLTEQQKQAEENKQSSVLDKEVEKTNEHIALLKSRIRGLRS